MKKLFHNLTCKRSSSALHPPPPPELTPAFPKAGPFGGLMEQLRPVSEQLSDMDTVSRRRITYLFQKVETFGVEITNQRHLPLRGAICIIWFSGKAVLYRQTVLISLNPSPTSGFHECTIQNPIVLCMVLYKEFCSILQNTAANQSSGRSLNN